MTLAELLEESLDKITEFLAAILLKLNETLLGGGLDSFIDTGVDEWCQDLLGKFFLGDALSSGAKIIQSNLGEWQGLMNALSEGAQANIQACPGNNHTLDDEFPSGC